MEFSAVISVAVVHVWFERALSHSGSISAELLAANTEITEGDWIVQVNQTKSNQTKSRTGKQAATQPDGTKYTREDNWTQVRLTRDRWNQSGWSRTKTDRKYRYTRHKGREALQNKTGNKKLTMTTRMESVSVKTFSSLAPVFWVTAGQSFNQALFFVF